MRNIAIIEVGIHSPVLILKAKPFTKSEADALHAAFHSIPQQESGINFIPYIPQSEHQMIDINNQLVVHYMFNNFLYSLSLGRISLDEIIKKTNVNIEHVTDDRPFFYYFESGPPTQIIIVLGIGLLLLLLLFVKTDDKKRSYFVIIGIAFIAIEIVILQKIGVFWGQNGFSLALCLSVILISSGLGGFFSKYIKNNAFKLKLVAISVPIVVLIALHKRYQNTRTLQDDQSPRLYPSPHDQQLYTILKVVCLFYTPQVLP